MLKRFLATVAFLLWAMNVTAQPSGSVHFTIERLADGVYAAIAADTGFAVSNAGIVDLGEGVLVFDTFISPRAAADLRRAAIALTGKPILYVVDSHFHNDHVRGNQEFPGARIISTVSTRKAIAENEPEEISWERANVAAKLSAAQKALADEPDKNLWPEDKSWVKYYESIMDSHESLRTVLPDVTFEGKLVLQGHTRPVELLETGRGHTESDLILYLPTEGIVFMGDLLFINRHPYLPDGFPDDWMHVLDRVATLNVRIVVPGHGPLGNSSHLATMAGYIKAVQDLGGKLAKGGATEQEIALQAVPPAFHTWWYSRFFPSNVKYVISLTKEHRPKE